jgi:hypothetical protein
VEPAGEDESGGKRLQIRAGVIREIVATVDLGEVSGRADRIVVEIPEIRLQTNESTGSAQLSVAEVTQVIVTAVLTAIAKEAPMALAKGPFTELVGLKDFTLGLPDSVESGASRVGGAALAIGAGTENAAEKAGKSVKGVLKSVGGLFGGGADNREESSPAAGPDQ